MYKFINLKEKTMGLFNKLFGKSGNDSMSAGSSSGSSGFNLLKDVEVLPTDKPTDILAKMPKTDSVISLEKSVISLDKAIISLSKDTGFDLNNHQAKVAVVMDYSGSMSRLYSNGAVQRVLTRLMPLAFKFDDNGELEVWIFSNDYHRLEPMDLSNFDTYVHDEITRKRYDMGSTEYAPVLRDVLHKYFTEDADSSNIPTFLIFITDGDNDSSDVRPTDKVIVDSSDKNIFIQFVGIGNSSFSYLKELDNLAGRTVDNTGFIKVADFERMNDDELYHELLKQYPDWVKAKTSKGIGW